MIITSMRGFGGAPVQILGDAMDDVAAQALQQSGQAPSPSVTPGQPSYGGGSGGGTDWDKLAAGAGDAFKAGTDAYNKITGSRGGPAGVKTTGTRAGSFVFCKAYYDKALAFINNAANKTRYTTLMTKRNAAAAHQAMLTEQKACGDKFKAGGFGKFTKGDAKGNAAAFKLYQACTVAATKKYTAAGPMTKDDSTFMAAFATAQHYVNGYATAQKNGMTIVTQGACTSATAKSHTALLAKASGASMTTWIVGGLILVGAGIVAWKLL